MGLDRTLQAVRRQLQAFNCDSYEIGIRNGQTGQMMNRTWTPAEIEKKLGYLKRMNAKGEDIYIRPAPSQYGTYVLIDDVEQSQLEAMKAKGFEPALVVETSPNNHQAWVKIPAATQAERTQAAKILAIGFDGDKNSADWNHYGRLAGFTNRKPEHIDKVGRSPFVLLRESKCAEASNGEALLEKAREVVTLVRDAEVKTLLDSQEREIPPHYESSRLKHWYRGFVEHLKERFQGAFDFSRADWQASLALFKKGHTAPVVAEVVRDCSPTLESRKGVYADDYVLNTVWKAAVWHDMRSRGANWDDVKDRLLTIAKSNLEAEQKEQESSVKASKYNGPSL